MTVQQRLPLRVLASVLVLAVLPAMAAARQAPAAATSASASSTPVPATTTAAATAAALPQRPIRLFLIGDSTIAPNGGYGNDLCQRLADIKCINLARAGRSSATFRAEGHWDAMRKLLKEDKGYRANYVLVQFGHNDQPGKPGRSTDLATEFPANLTRYASEASEDGAVPILVTPLARRSFKDGVLQDTLGPWADATRTVAAQRHAPLLDLHAASMAAFAAIGPAQAALLAPVPKPDAKGPDDTHLGSKGADLISAIVFKELTRQVPVLAPGTKP